MTFNCSKCGACCRAINCPHLTEDNLCSIYETRPEMCRIDTGYTKFGYVNFMSKEEYYKMNEQVCSVLQQQEKIT